MQPTLKAVQVRLIACGVTALVLAGSDLALIRAQDHAVGATGALLLLALYGAFGFTMVLPAVAVGWWDARGTTRPVVNRPLTLLLLAALGVGLVLINDETFAGEGLARSGLARPMRAAFTLAGAATLLFLVHRQAVALWRHRQGTTPRVWIAVLVMIAAGALVTDRTVLRGQYPQAHLQLFLASWLPLIAALSAGLRARGRASLVAFGLLATWLLVSGALAPSLVLGRDGPAALSRLKTSPRTGVSHIIDLAAPLLSRAVTSAAPPVDASRFLRPVKHDATTYGARLRERAALGRPPNVIIVSVDTVRADHLGFMGYTRPISPQWDRIAAGSIVFQHAYTPYPSSTRAFSSLFTSRWPEECPAVNLDRPVPPAFDLTSLLKKSGYRTICVTYMTERSARAGGGFGSFMKSFERMEALGVVSGDADAARIAERIEAIAAEPRTDDRPLLMWVHVCDPHFPYIEHFGHDFGSTDIDRYDSEIAHVDVALGRIRKALAAAGYWDESIFVLHSDHGEAFGEHDTEYHTSSLFEEQIHIPLSIRIPGVEPARLKEPVSLVDLLPTLTTLAGVDDPHARLRRGRDLSDLLLGERPDGSDDAFVFAQLLLTFYPSGTKSGLVRGRTKVILTPRGFPRWEIYDLDADPRELDNVVGRESAGDQELRGILQALHDAVDR